MNFEAPWYYVVSGWSLSKFQRVIIHSPVTSSESSIFEGPIPIHLVPLHPLPSDLLTPEALTKPIILFNPSSSQAHYYALNS